MSKSACHEMRIVLDGSEAPPNVADVSYCLRLTQARFQATGVPITTGS